MAVQTSTTHKTEQQAHLSYSIPYHCITSDKYAQQKSEPHQFAYILSYKRANRQISPLTSTLFFDYPHYLTVGTHHIDACGQMRYVDTVGIGSSEYLRAVHVV